MQGGINPVRFRDLGIEHGGHSGRETPEPIPNSEDKPVHVLHCTQVREPSGTVDRCHAHLTFFFYHFNWSLGSLITVSYESHSAMLHGQSGYCAPEKAKAEESCRAHLTSFY